MQQLALDALFAESFKGLADMPKGQRLDLGVLDTPEFRRVLAIPRRGKAPSELAALITAWLRTPEGTMILRDVQALALSEAHDHRGAFFPMGVGAGKTLVSLLVAVVLGARAPILLVPAARVKRTTYLAREYAKHFRIPVFLRVLSYQILGRESGAQLLERYRPDLIIPDECHKLKNRKAAVTKRVHRYFSRYPETMCVAMSGTISKRSLHDFAHIIRWCLKGNTPLPEHWNELESWASAIDERPRALQRYHPGVLLKLAASEDVVAYDDYATARKGFRRRLIETPGVVATTEQGCDASLSISGQLIETSERMAPHWEVLRSMWELPDGWPLSDGFQVWASARQFARGFFYRPEPRPEPEWMAAKKAWASFCREVLRDNRRELDSELQVARACANHSEWYGDEEYKAWIAIRDTFKYNQVTEWLDDTCMQAALDWLERCGGLVFSEQVAFGRTLAMLSGVPYFGRKGLTDQGLHIEDHTGPAILSLNSNKEGCNLQYRPEWRQALMVLWPPNGEASEQVLGRMHRDGQEGDEVSWDTLLGCYEDVACFDQSVKDAKYLQDTQGPQKLLIADIDMPDILGKEGRAWTK